MAEQYERIDDKLAAWISGQRLFFVGTAPSGDGGHVNVSPKGLIETFKVLGPSEVAYLDFTGGGVETIAHLRENGRICVMLCAFEGPPRIVRLHGRGEVAEADTPAFEELLAAFELDRRLAELRPGLRSIVRVDVTRIADSRGYAVPLLEYRGERRQPGDWIRAKLAGGGERARRDCRAETNGRSLDDLPGLEGLARRPG